MSTQAILAAGTIIFAVTTWATLAFGYARIAELQREDEQSDEPDSA